MSELSRDPGGESEDLDELRRALAAIYADLADDVARAGPVCDLSGRCCRFAEYGHTLFVSGPEMRLLLADAAPALRPLDDGRSCPWQDGTGRCTAREARPLGCRVYFCAPDYQDRMAELAEQYIARLKRLTADEGWPWQYATLHEHLRQAVAEGRLTLPASAGRGGTGEA